MKKAIILLITLLSAPAFAGNVLHYTPDVPLSQGFEARINHLCATSQKPLWNYPLDDFQKWMRQCNETKSAIDKDKNLTEEDRKTLSRKLYLCCKRFIDEIDTRAKTIVREEKQQIRQEIIKKTSVNLDVSNIQVQIVKYNSYAPTLYYSLKADIKNNGPAVKFYVTFQGLNSDGHEIDTIPLYAFLGEDKTVTLSNSRLIDTAQYNQIRTWQVKSISP